LSSPSIEVADIFRRHGPAWRHANAGHVSLGQLKVISAIESCRTAALGGHVARCENCAHTQIAYNSCRNRHCPKCQAIAAKEWLAEREAELLPVPYYHVVFTLPAAIGDIAYQNKAVLYGLLFKAAAETLIAIAADPKHLGARIGLTAVLHTWGSALTHHPHVHIIVPGGGILPDGQRWISCRPGFFLPVRVLSRLFRRLFLERLTALHATGRLRFFGDHAHLTERRAFTAYLAPLRKTEWVVYSKRPFGGPEAVLAYLSLYTHRIAISNSRLVAFDDTGVTFKWKDYRAAGRERAKLMTLAIDEFIRRFLIHVLPGGFHRIRYYGLLANGGRAENIARARRLLDASAPQVEHSDAGGAEQQSLSLPCPCCGGRMIVIETFARAGTPRYRPTVPNPIDSS
jgi:Putative transposase/Transposase zinc-binding domain